MNLRRNPPPVETGVVGLGDTRIGYTLRRSPRRRKTISLRVEASGVVIAAPVRVSTSEVEQLIVKRAAWIERQSAAIAARPGPRTFASGETVPFRGVELRLCIEEAACRGGVRLAEGTIHVVIPEELPASERDLAIRAALERWYRERALELVTDSVARWSPLVGATPARILIRDQRRRWGSCAPDGTLRLNWRLALAPPPLLDYVAVHELTHLLHRNHSPAFWDAVRTVLPDVAVLRAELRRAASSLAL